MSEKISNPQERPTINPAELSTEQLLAITKQAQDIRESDSKIPTLELRSMVNSELGFKFGHGMTNSEVNAFLKKADEAMSARSQIEAGDGGDEAGTPEADASTELTDEELATSLNARLSKMEQYYQLPEINEEDEAGVETEVNTTDTTVDDAEQLTIPEGDTQQTETKAPEVAEVLSATEELRALSEESKRAIDEAFARLEARQQLRYREHEEDDGQMVIPTHYFKDDNDQVIPTHYFQAHQDQVIPTAAFGAAPNNAPASTLDTAPVAPVATPDQQPTPSATGPLGVDQLRQVMTAAETTPATPNADPSNVMGVDQLRNVIRGTAYSEAISSHAEQSRQAESRGEEEQAKGLFGRTLDRFRAQTEKYSKEARQERKAKKAADKAAHHEAFAKYAAERLNKGEQAKKRRVTLRGALGKTAGLAIAAGGIYGTYWLAKNGIPSEPASFGDYNTIGLKR